MEDYIGGWTYLPLYIPAAAGTIAPLQNPCNFLLRGKPKKLPCLEPAREASWELMQRFTTAPILCYLDPDTSFVMEVALEEWHHWLEGARHPFLILTNYRNLEYFHGAKRLNPCQARWALFCIRFQFSVTYHPRSKNGKADALSRQLDSKNSLPHPEPILPPAVILGPIQWDLVEEIQRAHAEEPPPANCPPFYVLTPLRGNRIAIIKYAH
ncbi:hypothetical protein QTP70_003958 [Hemibagrus guttatus]|uniref:Reverse transcriptase RNase H-like domain-containing protein n=1 Tax=Hemibagrus guttatus TaxID=175788 RepID=A0AAE0RBU6_9TELE|nr:hypothetical protein QTP70_003958 [Hemibagrus guttatus]